MVLEKNGSDKLTYNHSDSYPGYLGEAVVEFCKRYSVKEMKDIFDHIVLVDKNSTPTKEQITTCFMQGLVDLLVSSQSESDWYCLLRRCQGDFEYLCNEPSYMIDNSNFIKDSAFCEYGYIINLDNETLEFYQGFQKKSQPENRYGTESDECGYYPCKLIHEFPLDGIDDVETIVKIMELGEDAEDIISTMELNSDYVLEPEEAKELGDRKIIAIWPSIEECAYEEARGFGYMTDHNERWFNIKAFGDYLLETNYIQFECTGRVVCYEY